MKMKTKIILFLSFLFSQSVLTQIPLPTLPNLTQIIAREATSGYFNHPFDVNDPRLFTRLSAGLNASNDFGGVPGAENYDIFYSDAAGNLDGNGAYITIECRYLGTSAGGGCNISHLELVFSNGFKLSPNKLASFYSSGSNYLVGSEQKAIDCDPNTSTTMGNNTASPNTMFLRLTFDFSNVINKVNISACQGDDKQYMSGGTTFNEENPSGTGYINKANCYNSIELVNITFEPLNIANFIHTGCQGDNYSITLGGITFDEQNPAGQALVPGTIGCDTLYTVNLSFVPIINESFNHTGCLGDNYSITLGGITFDEQNPAGQALVPGIIGCDTLYTVNLSFIPIVNESINYNGCHGDNYSITLGGITFDEQNPIGQALLPGTNGCDTLYTVNLSFVPIINKSFNHNGCHGDNYSITLGGITFDEKNPTGQALVPGTIGCDTLYNVILSFKECVGCKIFTPNIISLSSLTNSEFKITFNDECALTDITLSIFDRWGNLVKTGNQLSWNGKFNEIPCTLGVYVFVLQYYIDNVKFIKSGDITIIK